MLEQNNGQPVPTGKEIARQYGPVMEMQEAIDMFDQITKFCLSRMKEGVDFGLIPGTDRKCLYKPGAEKLYVWFGLEPVYEEKVSIIPAEPKPIISIDAVCKLCARDGRVRGWGVANCNSMEKKYRDRAEWVFDDQIPPGVDINDLEFRERMSKSNKPYRQYRIETKTEPYDILNTLKKMAFKRAFVAAILQATGTSEMFTQDVIDEEDLRGADKNERSGDEKKNRGRGGTRKPADPGGSLEERKAFATDLLDKCVAGKAIPAENSWAGQINNATDKNIGRIIETLTASYEKIPTDKRAPESKPAPADPDPAGPTAAEIKTQARKIAKDLLDGGQLDQSSWDAWDEKIANAIPAEAAGVLSKLEALAKEGKAA